MWKVNWCNHCGNKYELEAELPYDPANPLLGEMKTLIWKDTWTSMFITALSTIAKTLKQLKIIGLRRCAIHNIYVYTHTHTHTHTMEYYSAIKNNEILLFAATWMDLENIIFGQVRESQIPCNVYYIWNLKVVQMNIYIQNIIRLTGIVNKFIVTQGEGGQRDKLWVWHKQILLIYFMH